MKKFLFVILLLPFYNYCHSQILEGKVYDNANEPLVGAVIQITDTKYYAVSGFDGSYKIKMAPGGFTSTVRFIGMEVEPFEFTLESTQTLKHDFILTSNTQEIDDITVTSSASSRTIAGARIAERLSDQVINVVSAKTIELSPDLEVASVAQRISGVSLEMSGTSTGSSHAIIRGMSKRYNYTLINGIKIPSPDDKNRYVPLDIFPSDLLDKLEVSKTLNPSMEGDAAGGVINMVMKDAPAKFKARANFTMGYHELFLNRDFASFNSYAINDKSPLQLNGVNYKASQSDFTTENATLEAKSFVPDFYGSVSVGDRFLNDKLGAIVALSYSNANKGANSQRLEPDLLEGTSLPKLTKLSDREYSSNVVRMGLHTKLDFKFNHYHAVKLYAAYLNLLEDQVRDMLDISILGSNNIYDSNRRTFDTRFRHTSQQISNITLQGDHNFRGNHHFDWSLVYSNARKDIPDEVYFVRVMNTTLKQAEQSILIAEDGDNKRTWRFNNDRDVSAYLNYTYHIDAGNTKNEIKMGGLYRNKYRLNFYNSYYFDPSPGVQAYGHSWTPDDSELTYSTWETYNEIGLRIGNPTGSTTNEFNHQFYETLAAGYLQAKSILYNDFQILGGARIEITDWNYKLLAPRPGQDAEGGRDHIDILPSLHLKYTINEKSNLRTSYFYSVIRPGYYEILPYLDSDEDYKEIGNPDIKRCKVHNFDFRYENFFNPTDQFMIGVFYKNIIDPIEYARYQGEATWSKLTSWVRMPDNFGTASNYGFDVDFTKYIRRIGFKFNYTFTNSSITHSKQFKSRENPNDPTSEIVTTTKLQTRPLQGQSKHIGNASLLFKDPKKGLNAQLAFIYTGERIKNVSNYIDNDEWEKALVKMDFSVEKEINNWVVFIKAKNLLNTPYRIEIKQPLREDNVDFPLQGEVGNNYIIREDMYMRSFRVGVKYRL